MGTCALSDLERRRGTTGVGRKKPLGNKKANTQPKRIPTPMATPIATLNLGCDCAVFRVKSPSLRPVIGGPLKIYVSTESGSQRELKARKSSRKGYLEGIIGL